MHITLTSAKVIMADRLEIVFCIHRTCSKVMVDINQNCIESKDRYCLYLFSRFCKATWFHSTFEVVKKGAPKKRET